jgi:hypothetical protein
VQDNTIILSGDIHTHWVSLPKVYFRVISLSPRQYTAISVCTAKKLSLTMHSIEVAFAVPPFCQANDVPKFPCPTQANFSYDAATGANSLAVEFVSSSITSGWK